MDKPTEPKVPSRACYDSLSWHQIVEWALQDIERLRQQNDSPVLGPEQTAVLRGEIRALKRLVELPAMAVQPTPESITY